MWLSFEDGHVSSGFRTSAYKLDCLVRHEFHLFDFHWNRTFQAENAIPWIVSMHQTVWLFGAPGFTWPRLWRFWMRPGWTHSSVRGVRERILGCQEGVCMFWVTSCMFILYASRVVCGKLLKWTDKLLLHCTLYSLANEGLMRKMMNSFKLSRPSVSIIVRRVCKAITEHSGPLLNTRDHCTLIHWGWSRGENNKFFCLF